MLRRSPFQAVGVFRRALATASQIEEAESHFPFFRPKDNNDLIRTVLGRHCLGVGTVLTKLRLNLYQVRLCKPIAPGPSSHLRRSAAGSGAAATRTSPPPSRRPLACRIQPTYT